MGSQDRVVLVVASQSIDFSSGSTVHRILTTKAIGSLPSKVLRIGKSLPKGNQGSLIHSIGRGLGTIEKSQKDEMKEK